MSGKLFPSYINSPESEDGVLALLFFVSGGLEDGRGSAVVRIDRWILAHPGMCVSRGLC